MFGLFNAVGRASGAGARSPIGVTSSTLDLAQDARQLVARLEQATRGTQALTDPAQGYHLMGVLGQLGQSLERSVGHLGQWWQVQERTHRLAVEQGPFDNDPAAAVATTVASLTAAAAACADLVSALERAQICTSDLTYVEPARSRVPKSHRDRTLPR